MLKPLLLIAALTVTAQSFASQVVTRIIDTHAGHASVTKFADGSVMVFDAGRYSYAEHIVEQINAFADDGVIELLILSHTDGDHVGAVPEIFEAFTVNKVLRLGYVRCDEKPRQRNYCPWYFANEAVEKHEASEETIDQNLAEMDESIIGEKYVFGDATLSVVSGFSTPPEDWNLTDGGSDWLNAGSIVVRLEYDDKSILFTGDAWGRDDSRPHAGAEKFMVDNAGDRKIDSDVIIAPHHGADDGSSKEFIEAVSPTYVIFPAGGQYAHPRQATYDRYINAGVEPENFFRTDLCDSPQRKEWVGHTVVGQDDTGGDNDIDIVLPKDGEVVVKYVSLNEFGC